MVIWFIGLKISKGFTFELLFLASTVSRRKIVHTCPDCPGPIKLSDASVLEAALESLAKYNSESTSKRYSLVQVIKASFQVRLKCPVISTTCLKTAAINSLAERRVSGHSFWLLLKGLFFHYLMHIQSCFGFWVVPWNFHLSDVTPFYFIGPKVRREMDS